MFGGHQYQVMEHAAQATAGGIQGGCLFVAIPPIGLFDLSYLIGDTDERADVLSCCLSSAYVLTSGP